MKKLFKLFILAMLAVCGVACEQLGGAHNGGNDNGDNSGDAPGTPGTTESVFNITVSDITSNSAYVSVETSSKETYYFDVVLDCAVYDDFRRYVFAEVYNVVAVVFEHYFYDVLSDVMNVALNGCKDDLALNVSGLVRHSFLYDCESCFRGISAHEKLGKEYRSCLISFTYAVKCRDEFCIDYLK